MTEIASSRQLIAKCCSFARRDLVNLGIYPSEKLYFSLWKETPKDQVDETNCDWTFLYLELQHWNTDTAELINNELRLLAVLDSKRGMNDSRRQEEDTRALNRLSYLAAILGPLTITSGILSMGNSFAPGQAKFWVYWAISVPLCVLIVVWWLTSRIFGRWWKTKDKSSFVSLRTTQLE